MRFYCNTVMIVCLTLVGCGSATTVVGPPVTGEPTGAVISGKLLTGAMPVSGAHIYLLAVATTGYEKPSLSLLTAASASGTDTAGSFVLTAKDGSFTIPGTYTCTSSMQLYIYARGGDSGLGDNAAAGEMAALGLCAAAGSTVGPVVVNEVTTVAAAFALAGFATDPLDISSSGSSAAVNGVAIAFSNASHLASVSTGAAQTMLPSGNATVPQQTIHSLANILSACVHSAGPASVPCINLFAATGTNASTPRDSAYAAMAIAHSPASNVLALFALQPVSPPYMPSLGSAPNDWSLGIVFTGGGLFDVDYIAIDASGNAWITNGDISTTVTEIASTGEFLSGKTGYEANLYGAAPIAIDTTGNVWIGNCAVAPNCPGSLVELSPTGTVLSGPNGFTANGGLHGPVGLAFDADGNLWVTNYFGNNLAKLSPTGQVLSGPHGFTGGGLNLPGDLVVDSANHVWFTNVGFNVSEFTLSGEPLSGPDGFTGSGFRGGSGIAVDSQQNIWISNAGGYAQVSKISPTGAVLSGSGYTGGGIYNGTNYGGGYKIAVDGASHAWIPLVTGNTIAELANDGSVLSGPTGFGGGIAQDPFFAAIDGSGDVWVSSFVVVARNTYVDQVTEMIGLGTPVVTPVIAAVIGNKLGSRP